MRETDQAAQAIPRIRALLVESDANDVEMVSAVLDSGSDLSFDIVNVTTTRAARRALARESFDLVILDLGLPDSQGLETFLRLRPWVRQMPFVLLTGSGDQEIAISAMQHGAEDYLVKGETGTESMLRSIRYAIERHRGVRELSQISSELRQANEKLERLIQQDPLTEVLNRRGLQQAITREIEYLSREDRDVIVLLVDVDDFKRVNDQFGLAVGDVVLREIAVRLGHCVRGGDYVGRIGGDEFLMILANSDRTEVTRIAERTREMIRMTPITHGEISIRLTVSIGALLLSQDTPALDELLSRAHELLHRSKSRGKDRVSYQADEFDDTIQRRDRNREMCSRLSRGKNIATIRQPIVRLSDEQNVGWEFLSRYEADRLENPDHFFRLCTERNMLTLVDHHCLKSAIQAAEASEGPRNFHLNVFPSTLLAIPADHLLICFPDSVSEGAFCLEISEQQIIGDPEYLVEPVQALREAGLRFAIDDVGFGNSCLESLVLLEPDVIKIDKRVVTGLESGDHRIRQLSWYRDLAEAMGAELIAEGIEERTELLILRDLGIELGQGFLWGEPY